MAKKKTPLRSAPSVKTPADLDAFAAAAGAGKSQRSGNEEYPWHHPRVRDDVSRQVVIKMPEPLYLRLKYIAEHTPYNMTSFILERIGPEIEAEISKLTGR